MLSVFTYVTFSFSESLMKVSELSIFNVYVPYRHIAISGQQRRVENNELALR